MMQMIRFAPVLVIAAVFLVQQADARALKVGLAIPLEGSFAPLGEQVLEGFSLATKNKASQFSDVIEGEDRCDAESGAESADSFIEAGVDIVVGYLCAESLAAALPVLSEANIPVMTLSVRADIIGEEANRHDWLFYRLAPRASEEAQIASQQIIGLWADRPFALIEDGTILGREMLETVRVQLEERGLKPNFIDNYRPGQERQPSLVRRLKAAGAAKVFVGGERRDLAIIARDAAETGLDLRFMGGDALHAPQGEIALPEGTLAIIATSALPDIASQEAIDAFEQAGLAIEGIRLPAYSAGEILLAVSTRLSFNEGTVEDILETTSFETAMGPVSFDETGERKEPGFSLAIWRNGAFARISPREVLEAKGDDQ